MQGKSKEFCTEKDIITHMKGYPTDGKNFTIYISDRPLGSRMYNE